VIGLIEFGLVWTSLVLFGIVRFGVVEFGLMQLILFTLENNLKILLLTVPVEFTNLLFRNKGHLFPWPISLLGGFGYVNCLIVNMF